MHNTKLKLLLDLEKYLIQVNKDKNNNKVYKDKDNKIWVNYYRIKIRHNINYKIIIILIIIIVIVIICLIIQLKVD